MDFRLRKSAWFVFGMILFTALAFFIVVVCLGVANS